MDIYNIYYKTKLVRTVLGVCEQIINQTGQIILSNEDKETVAIIPKEYMVIKNENLNK
jgi:hypothetical protein